MKQVRASITTKAIVYCAFFVSLIIVLSQISFPLAFSPVPLTLGLFAVLVSGTLLGEKLGTLSVLIYILMGLVGLPVFAGFRSAAALFGATGGYIIGYVPAAFIAGIFAKAFKSSNKLKSVKSLILFAFLLLAVGVCYLFGTIWFAVYANVTFYSALTLCVFPFIPLDLIKITLSVILTVKLKRFIRF